MSNILPTIGRNVQYVTPQGDILAAIITAVDPVVLAVYRTDASAYPVEGAVEFNPIARVSQSNVYKLTWQGR
jgi:hypothetical protein